MVRFVENDNLVAILCHPIDVVSVTKVKNPQCCFLPEQVTPFWSKLLQKVKNCTTVLSFKMTLESFKNDMIFKNGCLSSFSRTFDPRTFYPRDFVPVMSCPTNLCPTTSGSTDSLQQDRSEERSVGKECRQKCRSRWWPYH